ncbi:methylated-DNA--[protein]-cysteine S-methyltransferase [Haliangium sp.]|uniref:methylated-DNA--[protein]-cysteine S-methyltransferase n=1 Tax=Haliangium sp. TaxID=2663208 RepID=UPI003D1372FF
MYFDEFPSPVGRLRLVGDEAGLRHIAFEHERHPLAHDPAWVRAPAGFFEPVRAQLDEYFAGARQRFELALCPHGTPFQRRVWDALTEIPYGVTISYGELAGRLGQPKAVRAVGAANGRNPLPIVIPCHRVIGADGSLTGFGGGISVKRALLAVEGALPARDLFDGISA